MKKSYKCECGRDHKFPTYVHEHWSEEIKHTCPCGVTNTICKGEVIGTDK